METSTKTHKTQKSLLSYFGQPDAKCPSKKEIEAKNDNRFFKNLKENNLKKKKLFDNDESNIGNDIFDENKPIFKNGKKEIIRDYNSTEQILGWGNYHYLCIIDLNSKFFFMDF